MARQRPTGFIDPQTGAFYPTEPKKKKRVWPWVVAAVFVIGVGWAALQPEDEKAPAENAEADRIEQVEDREPETEEIAETETNAPETEKKPTSLWTAIFGEPKETEPEVIPERGTSEWNEWWIEKHYADAMTATKRALENYYEKPKTSYNRNDWTISVYDENDTFYASTKFTFQERKYDVIFIGQLVMEEDNPAKWSYAWKGHFLYAENQILFNDHYADDFLKLVGFVEDTP